MRKAQPIMCEPEWNSKGGYKKNTLNTTRGGCREREIVDTDTRAQRLTIRRRRRRSAWIETSCALLDRPNDIYKFITLLPKDYCLIPGNGAKNSLDRPNDIYKFITLLPKDYCLIPGNNAKNLLATFCV